MINKNVTVVSVSYNNARNLKKTLTSILDCPTKPQSVIVVDGGSADSTSAVVKKFCTLLNIKYISEPDSGIYDAMNKGRMNTDTPLVHYLNGGDYLNGDPYLNVTSPCLLPVCITDNDTGKKWVDKIKLQGYGYCHQGIIFPSDHMPYDIGYTLAGDFNLIAHTFHEGLRMLPQKQDGVVHYNLDGISSRTSSLVGVLEISRSACRSLPASKSLLISSVLIAKTLIPRPIRRYLAAKAR